MRPLLLSGEPAVDHGAAVAVLSVMPPIGEESEPGGSGVGHPHRQSKASLDFQPKGTLFGSGFFCFCFWEMGSHCIAQTCLKLTILLSQPLKC